MELSTDQIVDAYLKAGIVDKNSLLGFANFPLLDGVTLPEDRADMYRMWGDEKRSKIDMMIGSNLDELRSKQRRSQTISQLRKKPMRLDVLQLNPVLS
jgi:para-nitrobenzyl esterase